MIFKKIYLPSVTGQLNPLPDSLPNPAMITNAESIVSIHYQIINSFLPALFSFSPPSGKYHRVVRI